MNPKDIIDALQSFIDGDCPDSKVKGLLGPSRMDPNHLDRLSQRDVDMEIVKFVKWWFSDGTNANDPHSLSLPGQRCPSEYKARV